MNDNKKNLLVILVSIVIVIVVMLIVLNILGCHPSFEGYCIWFFIFLGGFLLLGL